MSSSDGGSSSTAPLASTVAGGSTTSSTTLEQELLKHLSELPAPFLFIGSGVSLRYCGAENWEGLLRKFAAKTGKPYEYFRALGDDNLPAVASHIATEFADQWWAEPEFEDSRRAWQSSVRHVSDPLKIEISRHLSETVSLANVRTDLLDELGLLREAQVDGIITTNYDQLLEQLFPAFKTYVGQSELVFADIQGVGEIYKIHGSVSEPSSLVLTKEDYHEFDRRSVYLAAKLLTLFVEHPVVFIGYSISDENVRSILEAIVSCIEPRRAEELRNRLIFVEWVKDCVPILSSSVYTAGPVVIPVVLVRVPDFGGLFQALSQLQRVLPARTLRLLKERIFELVKSNDPDNKLAVSTDIDSAAGSQLEVVFGVGLRMTALGIVGIDRVHVFEDVLGAPDRELPTDLMIESVLPRLTNTSVICPVFKYLSEASLLDESGGLLGSASVDAKIRSRVTRTTEDIKWSREPRRSYASIAELERMEGTSGLLNQGWSLAHTAKNDLDGLREFLTRRKSLARSTKFKTSYAKAVSVYDWLKWSGAAASLSNQREAGGAVR